MAKRSRKNAERNNRILLAIMSVVLLISVSVTIWALFFRSPFTMKPDYAPLEEEQYAKSFGDDTDEKLEQVEGGGAVSLTYTTEVDVDLSAGQLSLYFVNPSKSNQDMVLQVVVHDQVIAQSGTIKPGKLVEKLALAENASELLQEGGYEGEFVVLYYQPDTHEKMIVNTEIPVNITVK